MDGPCALAEALDKLIDRLDSVPRHGDRAVVFSVPRCSSALSRIAVSLDILRAEEAGPGTVGLESLERARNHLEAALSSVPDRCTLTLAAALEDLSAFLAARLEALDGGSSLEEVLADPGWSACAARTARAPGPLAVLDSLADIMTAWVDGWSGVTLGPTAEEDLAAGWRRLRAYGDSLFGSSVLGGFTERPEKRD